MRTLFLLIIAALVFSCNPPDSPVPVIKKITPGQGSPGSTILVEGSFLNFAQILYLDTSRFYDFLYDPETRKITCIVPEMASKKYTLSLGNAEGKSNGMDFIVLPSPPFIESIKPLTVSPGDTIEIKGKYFVNSNLEVHFESLIVKNFISQNTTSIRVKVTNDMASGYVKVTNINGNSNQVYVNLKDESTILAPVITSVNPAFGLTGSTFKVSGKNFQRGNLTITFQPSVLLTNGSGFIVNSDTLVDITIPVGAVTGLVKITNSFGEASFQFEVLPAPVITQILPKSNAAGGPMMIYGKNLKPVTGIRVGNTLVSKFNYYRTGDDEEIISMVVPVVSPANVGIKAYVNNLLQSNEIKYEVLAGSMSLPKFLPEVVVPKSPPSGSLNSIDNSWLTTSGSRFQINANYDVSKEYFLVTDGQDIIGIGDFAKNSFVMNGYYCKLDTQYHGVKRIILTPIEAGNQTELIFPFYLESIVPSNVKQGDSVQFKVRYLSTNEISTYNVFIQDSIYDFTYLKNVNYNESTFKMRIGVNFPPGQKVPVFINTSNGNSNILNINITSK